MKTRRTFVNTDSQVLELKVIHLTKRTQPYPAIKHISCHRRGEETKERRRNHGLCMSGSRDEAHREYVKLIAKE
jgi:hypothetical protein